MLAGKNVVQLGHSCSTGVPDILSWLGSSVVVDQAAKAADEHEALRSTTRELRASLEDRFKLASVRVRI